MIVSFKGKYAFLSNMHECEIKVPWNGGMVFPSVENAYQASKCANLADMQQFTAMNPYDAKKMGRKVQMHPNFPNMKYQIMRELLDIKFDSHKELMDQLLMTAPESLVEGNIWHDNYWGVCSCDKCRNKIHENKLGELLQRKRNLSAKYSDTFTIYCGSIYRRSDSYMIQRPAVLYDTELPDYVLVKLGELSTCMDYMQRMQTQNPALFSKLHVLEFDVDPINNPLGRHVACEKMNWLLQYTGNIKKILGL